MKGKVYTIQEFVDDRVYYSDVMLGHYKVTNGKFYRSIMGDGEWEACPLDKQVLQRVFMELAPCKTYTFKLASQIDGHRVDVKIDANTRAEAAYYFKEIHNEYQLIK